MSCSSPAVSIGSLYSHVLGVAFSFCNMHELAMACAVNQGWRNAIGTVPSLLAPANLNTGATAEVMCHSNLARHVGSLVQQYLSNRTTIDCAELTLMSQRMVQLHRMSFNLSLARQGELVWPRKLRELSIRFCSPASCQDLTSALDALAQLPVLSSLTMVFHVSIKDVRFASLSKIGSLRRLSIRLLQNNPDFSRKSLVDRFDAAQIDDLRLLSQLESLSVPYAYLPQLLASPMPFGALTELDDSNGGAVLNNGVASVLSAVRGLTSLHLGTIAGAVDLSFLPLLPLQSLWIGTHTHDQEIPAILHVLERCTTLTSLTFVDTVGLTASNLADLLSHLVHLQQLSISTPLLESLAFLDVGRSPHLAKGLVHLELCRCRGISNRGLELYLRPLTALTSLVIHDSFQSPLSERELHALRPPSALLPALTSFNYEEHYNPSW